MMVEHEYPDRNTPILLYCGRGDRSALAALTLKRLGYRNVASVEGGLNGWREKGLPVPDWLDRAPRRIPEVFQDA